MTTNLSPAKKTRGNPNAKPPAVSYRASAWLSTAVYEWMRERLIAGGADPSQIPVDESPRLLRLPEVRKLTGLSQTTIYERIKGGRFPRQIPL